MHIDTLPYFPLTIKSKETGETYIRSLGADGQYHWSALRGRIPIKDGPPAAGRALSCCTS